MKPILFNTEMVQAILEGRKTVTRRLLKLPSHIEQDADGTYTIYCEGTSYSNQDIPSLFKEGYLVPRHKPGDILYVRETWRVGAWNENTSSIAVDYKTGNAAIKEWIYIEDEEEFQRYWIQSTDDAEKAGLVPEPFDGQYHWDAGEGPTRWRPSLHMPKEAARIFLRVKDVKIERLQDITNLEAKREGVTVETDNSGAMHRTKFILLWDSLIDQLDVDKYSWMANPWVWVISFERISKEEAI